MIEIEAKNGNKILRDAYYVAIHKKKKVIIVNYTEIIQDSEGEELNKKDKSYRLDAELYQSWAITKTGDNELESVIDAGIANTLSQPNIEEYLQALKNIELPA